MDENIYTETLELEIDEEDYAGIRKLAERLQLAPGRYMVNMAVKGYALSTSIDANDMYHISPKATEDQKVNVFIDSAANQMIFVMGTVENLTHELGYFTRLELLKERLGVDTEGCKTFSDWIFKEARKRNSKFN